MSELSEVKLEIQRTGRLLERLQISMSDVQQQAHDIKTLVAGNKELGILGHGDMLKSLDKRVIYLEQVRGAELVKKEKEKLKSITTFLGGTGLGAAVLALYKWWASIIKFFS